MKSSSTLCRKGSCTSSECSNGVGRAADADLRQRLRPAHRVLVQGDAAERRREGKGVGQSDPAHRHAVGRAEHHDAADRGVQRNEQGIGAGRDRPRVDVAGVGHDQGLRSYRRRV